MPWQPDRVGPSLMLYLTRWTEMCNLTEALQADSPKWDLEPKEREQASAVHETANAQAETLLYLCVEKGVEPALAQTVAFRRPSRIRGHLRDEWWTGYVELRCKGPGRQRGIGTIDLQLNGEAALLVYLSLTGIDANTRARKLLDQLAQRRASGTTVEEVDRGIAVCGRIPLTEGKLFTEVIEEVRKWIDEVVVTPWPKIASAVRG